MPVPHRSRLAAVLAAAVALALGTACMRSPEEKFAQHMARGMEYLETANYGAALIEFKNAQRAKSTDPEPHYRIALCLMQRGQAQDAIQAVQQALKLDPNHVEANLLMARFMVQIGSEDYLPQAEELVNNVLGEQPGNTDALYVLAATRARLGSAADAERLLEEALRGSPEHLLSSMALARLKLNQGDKAGAEEALTEAVDRATDKKAARIALGQFLLGQNRDDEAKKQFESILSEDDAYGPALLGLGMLHLKRGEREPAEEVYRRASKIDEDLYRPLYGQILLLNNKRAEAVAEFERLASRDPKDRTARGRLIGAYVANNQESEAEALLTKVLADTPNDADARLQRAEIYRRGGRLGPAKEDLAKALEFRANFAEAHLALSRIYQQEGDVRLQRQSLSEALSARPDLLQARMDMAQTMLRGDTPRAAIDLLNEAPENQREAGPVVSAKIWAHIALKEASAARALLDRVVPAVRDASPEFLLQDGILLALARKYSEARASLEKSLALNSTDVRTVNAIGGTYLAENKLPAAVDAVRKQAEQHPDNSSLQLALALWLLRANDPAGAEQAYIAADKAGDRSGQALLQLARIYSERKEFDKANATLERAIAELPRPVDALIVRATIAEQTGDIDAALADYRKAIALQPDNFLVLNNLAYILATRKGELDEALSFAQRAKEFAPTVAQPGQPGAAEVDDTLGWVFYLRGVYASALVHLRAAAAASPNSAVTQYHLAMAYAKNGDVAAGRRAYEAGLKLDPNAPEAEQARQILGGGRP